MSTVRDLEGRPRAAVLYSFRGHDRAGTAIAGRTSVQPAVFIEKKYRAGWVDAEVYTSAGELVGEIWHNDHRRTWWAARWAQ